MEAWQDKKQRAIEALMAISFRMREHARRGDWLTVDQDLQERGAYIECLAEFQRQKTKSSSKQEMKWSQEIAAVQAQDQELIAELELFKKKMAKDAIFFDRMKNELRNDVIAKGSRFQARA